MKKLLILCTLLLFAHITIAQPQLIWQNCYGGWGIDYLYHAIRTLDGGYIAVGTTGKAGGHVTGPLRGGLDAWIIKTDSNGVPQWDTVLGGSGMDIAGTVRQAPDSSYFLVISSNSADGDMTGSSHGGYDTWVAKLAATGDLSWIRGYGGSGSDNPQQIALTPDGNCILAGASNSPDGDISSAKGSMDAWVVKISQANGNLIWEHSYGSTGNEGATDIATTADGGFIFCGTHANVVKQVTAAGICGS